MSRRTLLAVLAVLLAVLAGPHLILMAAVVIAAAVVFLAWMIAETAVRTGWGVVPGGSGG